MAGENTSSQALGEGRITDARDRDDAPGAVTSRSAAHPVPARDSDIRLVVPARPENVAVIRHVIGALADALGLPEPVIHDVRLAVTEACTNVVRHAYDEGGTVDVVVRPVGDALEVVVADSGRGLAPSLDTAGPGLGMSLMRALADWLEVERNPGTGSRLRMRFAGRRTTAAMGLA